MDAQTIAAFSGWAAAVVAATFAGLQFYVGRKQAEAALTSSRAALINAQSAGRHTVAEFRQKWIDKVIDTLCELYSITATTGDRAPAEQARAIVAARTKLGFS